MIFKLAEKIPPCLCRTMARDGWKPKSSAALAKECGISESYVHQLSFMHSWKGVAIDMVEKFSSACGVDLTRKTKIMEYLRNSKMTHIKRGTVGQRRMFHKIFTDAAKVMAQKSSPEPVTPPESNSAS